MNINDAKLDDLNPKDLSSFYLREKGKMNIWTYLFSRMNESLSQIITMCELEGKTEFCIGIEESLNSTLVQLEKVNNKILLEKSKTTNNLSWDI